MDRSRDSAITPSNTGDLPCRDIIAGEGVRIADHLFLLSLLPCCAQIALPYWAKVVGWITNDRDEETLFDVVIMLFDGEGTLLAAYSDTVALEAGERGQFEVKLIDHQERVAEYTISAGEAEPDPPRQTSHLPEAKL